VSYEVRLRPVAERDLGDLPKGVQRRILDALAALASDPRPPGSEDLHGDLRGVRRLRVGDYRVSYVVQDAHRLVRVGRIGHRSTFYKRLKGK